MFIEFKTLAGLKPVLININDISRVYPKEEGIAIYLKSHPHEIRLTASYEIFLEVIKENNFIINWY